MVDLTSTNDNVGIGYYSGYESTGSSNVYIGSESGRNIVGGGSNVILGYRAGRNLTATSGGNVILGSYAGDYSGTISSSVYIGTSAGSQETNSQRLYIANSNTTTPLIYGEFATPLLKIHGDLYLPSDSYELFFGAGNDMKMYYDGTDGYIMTDLVAASDLKVDCGANKTIELQTTVWDDLRVPVSSIKRIGNSDPDWETFLDGTYALAFDKSVDQEVAFFVQIPHSWKLGTDLHPHVHWSPSDTDTGSVTWKLEYTIADITGTFGSTTTMSVTDAADGTAYKHQYADLGDIDMSGYTDTGDVSIILICRLYRDVDDGDDYDADAFLHEIDFHFEKDTIGSRQETSK